MFDPVINLHNLTSPKLAALRKYVYTLPEWDGKQRAQQIFSKYLGATDTPRNCELARVMLLGALLRAQGRPYPFDYLILISAPKGVGKSMLLKKLSAKPELHFCDTFPDVSKLKRDDKNDIDDWVLDTFGTWFYEFMPSLHAGSQGESDYTGLTGFRLLDYKLSQAKVRVCSRNALLSGVLVVTTSYSLSGWCTLYDGCLTTAETRPGWCLPIECTGERQADSNDITDEEVSQIWAEVNTWAEQGQVPVPKWILWGSQTPASFYDYLKNLEGRATCALKDLIEKVIDYVKSDLKTICGGDPRENLGRIIEWLNTSNWIENRVVEDEDYLGYRNCLQKTFELAFKQYVWVREHSDGGQHV